MRTSRKIAAGATSLLIAGGALGVPAGTAVADHRGSSGSSGNAASARQAGGTTCEAPSGLYVRCTSSSKGRAEGDYVEKGDKIHIYDRYRNGRSTKVLFQVKGSGIAEFSSKGKKHRVVDRDYTENKPARIKVCTSWSQNAKCSPWSKWHPA